MSGLFSVIGLLASIVCLVCWIMVLIKIFKDNVGFGILGIICGIFAFVYGWIKVNEYGIKNVMLAWTIAFVVVIIANAIGGAAVFSQIMSEMPS